MSPKYAQIEYDRAQSHAAHPMPHSPQALGMVTRTPDPSLHLLRRRKLQTLAAEIEPGDVA